MATSLGHYGVSLGAGQLEQAVASADVLLVDDVLLGQLPQTTSTVIAVKGAEDTKTLAGCERVILALRAAGVRRGDHLVAIGGGAVQDVATFVADVYMRGIAWSYVPSTLMAMVDSCIGGKSSINVGEVKNLVGGIYPPRHVYVDPMFLGSLSPAALASGFAEAAKIAFCRSAAAFTGYLERYSAFADDPTELIHHVLLAKKWFIEIDEHDRAERRLLNFGHTFGHALEAATDHALPHGLAVAVGVLCATAHPLAARNEATIALGRHCTELIGLAGDLVPAAVAGYDPGVFERALRSDKKHSAGWFHLILPAEAGGVAEVRLRSDDAGWASVAEATRRTIDTLRSELP